MNYVFEAGAIHDFRYCPYCGAEIMTVAGGDYRGYVQCIECDDCDDKLEFMILEEVIERHPKWLIDVITKPYMTEINRLRSWRGEQQRKEGDSDD